MNLKREITEMDALLRSMNPNELADEFDHLRGEFPQEFGNAAFGAVIDIESEPEAINPERAEKAAAITAALAEKFDRPESDFSVIKSVNKAGESIFDVALTATHGIEIGDQEKMYDSRRSENEMIAETYDPRFNIVVAGHRVDTRESTDLDLLRAIAAHNPEISEWVWRTGEPDKVDAEKAPVAYMHEGLAGATRISRANGLWFLKFRPSVRL